ncbi:response regulator [Massilia sp. H-1]|nr:response regulator [Massilia sp. H-1]
MPHARHAFFPAPYRPGRKRLAHQPRWLAAAAAHGFAVEAFLSAELLLARTETNTLDCLLLDIDLDGMSGLDLQATLQHLGDTTPIVFITGRDHPDARARAQPCRLQRLLVQARQVRGAGRRHHHRHCLGAPH